MKLTKSTIKLICELEYIIGNECYNPNSTNGWTKVEGLEFRYPVCFRDTNDIDRKTSLIVQDIDKDGIGTMRYKFGANHLYVGCAIVRVLKHLEDKYGLDFNELTKKK